MSDEDVLRRALAIHTRYASEIHWPEGKCGHFWQGRLRTVPMDEAHLHVCLRHVEISNR